MPLGGRYSERYFSGLRDSRLLQQFEKLSVKKGENMSVGAGPIPEVAFGLKRIPWV